MVARLWTYVDVRGPDECWPFTASATSAGYGQINLGGRPVVVHRLLLGLGTSPAIVDHVCHNRDLSCPGGRTCPHRRCCNPSHWRLTTHLQNIRAGRAPEANRRRFARTSCARCGAALRTGPSGARRCPDCNRRFGHRYARGLATLGPYRDVVEIVGSVDVLTCGHRVDTTRLKRASRRRCSACDDIAA